MADGLIRKGFLFIALFAICAWFTWKPADGVEQLPRLLASIGLFTGAVIAGLSGVEKLISRRFNLNMEMKHLYASKLAILFGSILILVFVSLTVFRLLYEYRRGLTPEVFMNQLFKPLLLQTAVCFIPLSYDATLRLAAKWEREVLSKESAKQKLLELQLQAISNQVNPHFLFNSLNALANLVRNNTVAAESYIVKLANCYRYLLDMRKRSRVDWPEEKQFIEEYVGLLKVRFGGNIHIQIDSSDHFGFQVVPFSVFMWIENAIRSCVIAPENPVGIVVRVKEGLLEIETRGIPVEIADREGIPGPEDLLLQYQLLTGTEPKYSKDGVITAVKLPVFNSGFKAG